MPTRTYLRVNTARGLLKWSLPSPGSGGSSMRARLLAVVGVVGCMGAPMPQDLGQTEEPVTAVGSLTSDFIPIPPDVPRIRPQTETVVAACAAPITLFVNFDGATLTGGQQCNNSTTGGQGCSFIVTQAQVNYP